MLNLANSFPDGLNSKSNGNIKIMQITELFVPCLNKLIVLLQSNVGHGNSIYFRSL
jgi:hypothetical protein